MMFKGPAIYEGIREQYSRYFKSQGNEDIDVLKEFNLDNQKTWNYEGRQNQKQPFSERAIKEAITQHILVRIDWRA